VRQHSSRMLAVARRFLRCEEDCADAVQDAFLSAFRSLHRFQGNSTLATWLHRIVVNVCLMRLRVQSRSRAVPIDDLMPSFDEKGHPSLPESARFVSSIGARRTTGLSVAMTGIQDTDRSRNLHSVHRPPPILATTVASTSAGATADALPACAIPPSPPPRRQHTGVPLCHAALPRPTCPCASSQEAPYAPSRTFTQLCLQDNVAHSGAQIVD
jgi:RNA polymerase sigma factor (sigma-70 family)